MLKNVILSLFITQNFKKEEQFRHNWYIFVTNYGRVRSNEIDKEENDSNQPRQMPIVRKQRNQEAFYLH